MKRICIVRHGYYPADPRVRRQAEALKSRGFEVDVICLRRDGELSRDRVDGVGVYRLPLSHRRRGMVWYLVEYSRSLLLSFFRLSLLHLRKRYRVVQVNTVPDFLVFASIVPKTLGARIMLDMHEAVPELLRSKFRYGENHPWVRMAKLVERLSMRFADWVTAVNPRILTLYASRGLPLSKTVLIPNVPDEELFDYRKYSGSEGGKDSFTIISHGSILERYGFQLLIKALHRVREHIPGTNLIILGEGEYLGALMNLTKQLSLEDQVTFLDRVPLEEVPALISQADVGAVPVINDEFTNLMSPNKLFEYVAMQKPVVAASTDGMQSYFDGSCLMFFRSPDDKDLARCILELYRSRAKRKELVQNAWERYEKIRWRITKEKYLEVFDNMLGKEGSRQYLRV